MTTDVSIECILQPDILTCSADTPLATAARRMMEARCSSILVLDDAGAVLGIWTEHDALALDIFKRKGPPLEHPLQLPARGAALRTLLSA